MLHHWIIIRWDFNTSSIKHKKYQIVNVYHNAMYHGFFEENEMFYVVHYTS